MKNKLFPFTLILVGLFLLVGAIYLALILPGQAKTEIPYPDIKRVSLTNALKAFESKSAIFVDVRDANSFSTSHIPGSLNIPENEIESRLGEISAFKWIITYCS